MTSTSDQQAFAKSLRDHVEKAIADNPPLSIGRLQRDVQCP